MALAAVETLAGDVRGAEALRAKANSGDPEALRAAAKQFEAMFLQMMLKTMRETKFTTEDDPFASSQSLKVYQEMLDQQWALRMSAGRGVGFADAMYAALSRRNMAPTDTGAEPTTAAEAASTIPGSVSSAGSLSAPTPSGQQTGTDKQGFIDTMRPYAEQAAQSLGLPANFILAQAALETGWGKREIVAADGTNSHNLFGIKAGANWQGETVDQVTTEYQHGLAVQKTETFRVYASYGEAFQDYAGLLARRYAKALAAGDSAESFATAIASGGYATDPAYAAKLRRVIGQLS
jgi:flagellar protein FlgJ